MDKSAILLVGGSSTRFGQDKGLVRFKSKPLIKHVLEAVDGLVDEKIVVVSSKSQAENYVKVLDSSVNVIVDTTSLHTTHSPLIGAMDGFEKANGKYAVLLPCDAPFISKSVISLLFELCINRNAAIPRWPNGYIEPLQAVYCTKAAYEAAKEALSEGKLNMQSMVDKLRHVRFVSTLVLQQLDPELKTFFNINTPVDLKKAEFLLKHQNYRKGFA